MREWTLIIVAALGCRPTSANGPAALDEHTGLGMVNTELAFAMRNEYKSQVAEPPMGLVPTDGSELGLRALEAQVRIQGPLAHTELHFTFHNAEPRSREGRFRVELPAGAAVGRFAMKVGGEWREARSVTREKGRQVFEEFLHKKVDPALLEQDAGNQFSARVFPIPATSDKEIILAYDHVVSATQPYVLPLHGLPAIPQLVVDIDRDGQRTLDRKSGIPEDVIVDIAAGDIALAAGDAFVARVELPEAGAVAPLDRVLILVDTSASRTTVMGKQAQLVHELVAALPASTSISIAAYDHDVTELYRGPAGKAAGSLLRLYDHGALGASDLGRALERAAVSGMSRVILIGDGVPTLGETVPAKLVGRLGNAIARIDAIQIGTTIDRDVLGLITRAGKQPGAILDGRDARRVVHQLGSALASELPIAVDGASSVWPATTRGLAPGEPVWITGRRSNDGPLAIRIGARRLTLTPRLGDAARISRAVARSELAALGEQVAATADTGKRAELETKIEKIALAHDLMSSRTSMLVLESDADEIAALGKRPTPAAPTSPPTTATPPPPAPIVAQAGEVITIRDSAPVIDPTSTQQGITIDKNYTKNIPVPGRTFESALGAAAGSQGDGTGVSFSGSTSLENHYFVDGVYVSGVEFGPNGASPYTGRLHDVMFALASKQRDRALEIAAKYRLDNPGDLAAIIALGEALEARGATRLAARAYGSIIDQYPNRADLVRAAGERLDRISGARSLAIDAYRRSLADRPDHLSTYRLLAFALVRSGRADEALDLVLEARRRARNSVRDVLLQDARVIGAHVVARDPSRAFAIRTRLGGAPVATAPGMHVVLSWETDANDVDLHVIDNKARHAFYAARDLPSGGHLIDDLTDGFGPEMFVVDRPAAFPYALAVHYFNRGPEGLGIGTVQVIRHDGNGNITVDDRPFVLQKDQATIYLGRIER